MLFVQVVALEASRENLVARGKEGKVVGERLMKLLEAVDSILVVIIIIILVKPNVFFIIIVITTKAITILIAIIVVIIIAITKIIIIIKVPMYFETELKCMQTKRENS